MTLPSADNVVRQGVTTIFEGPDGNSPVPLTPFLKKIEALRKTIKNVHRARIDSQRRYGPRQPPAYARTLSEAYGMANRTMGLQEVTA